MNIISISCGFTISNIQKTKAFYEKHFDATTLYEIESYIVMKLGDSAAIIEFNESQASVAHTPDLTGAGFNFEVDHVEQAYNEIMAAGVTIMMPYEEHPWGEKGFSLQDPNGLTIYVFERVDDQTETD